MERSISPPSARASASRDFRVGPRADLGHATGEAVATLEPVVAEQVVAHYRLRGATEAGNRVEVDGNPVPVRDDGSFATELPLRAGENTFGVLVRDDRGRVTVANLRVQVLERGSTGREIDAASGVPAMTVVLPPQGVVLGTPRVTVSGATAPEHRVTVNDDSVRVNPVGDFAATVTLPEGRSTLVVGVRDADGNQGFVRRDVEVRSQRLFLVAVADGIVGSRGSAGTLRTTAPASGGTWYEGRLAYYLRGQVAGRYRLTSGYDSGRRSFGSLFRWCFTNGLHCPSRPLRLAQSYKRQTSIS